jgi:hypothetical protein
LRGCGQTNSAPEALPETTTTDSASTSLSSELSAASDVDSSCVLVDASSR